MKFVISSSAIVAIHFDLFGCKCFLINLNLTEKCFVLFSNKHYL